MGRTIAAGQRELIEVSISSKVRSGWCDGHVGAQVTIRTNDAANPRVKLVACATVKHAIKTQPLPDRFGKFTFERFSRASAQQTMTIRLVRGDGGPLQPEIREVGFLGWDASEGKSRLQPSPNLSAVVHELDPGERYDLTVTARAPWPPWGKHLSVVVATGVPAQPEYTVRFYLDVKPRLRAEPDHFLLEEARSPTGGRVRLRWSDDEPPGHIVSAEVDDPKLHVEVLETTAGLEVLLRAPEEYVFPKPGPCVTLRTDDEVVPMLRIGVERR